MPRVKLPKCSRRGLEKIKEREKDEEGGGKWLILLQLQLQFTAGAATSTTEIYLVYLDGLPIFIVVIFVGVVVVTIIEVIAGFISSII